MNVCREHVSPIDQDLTTPSSEATYSVNLVAVDEPGGAGGWAGGLREETT